MDSGKAREMFEKYAVALAYVAVETPEGDQTVGSAFHVGEGVFVTARHVLENNKILDVASTERTYIPLSGAEALEARIYLYGDPVHEVNNGRLTIASGPHFHPDDRVDVAVFKVRNIDSYTAAAPLGYHLDDWLGVSDFVLTEAIVLGYPPVPLTREPILIGARAEVNAMVDRIDVPHVHFILSAMPRGGFSGGLVLSEYDMVLGLVTSSLITNHSSAELGFMTVIGVEPIYVCLTACDLLPECQSEGWDGLWNNSGRDG